MKLDNTEIINNLEKDAKKNTQKFLSNLKDLNNDQIDSIFLNYIPVKRW